MTVTHETKLSPYQYGEIAFNKGIKASARDQQFLDAHIKGLQVGEGIPALKQWNAGWKSSQSHKNIIVEYAAKEYLKKFTAEELRQYNIKTVISDAELIALFDQLYIFQSTIIDGKLCDDVRDKITMIIIEKY